MKSRQIFTLRMIQYLSAGFFLYALMHAAPVLAAAPSVSSADFLDRDHNGFVETIVVNWSEPVSVAEPASLRWELIGGSLNLRYQSTQANQALSSQMELKVGTGTAGTISTPDLPRLRFLSGDVRNSQNEAAIPPQSYTQVNDLAQPVILNIKTGDLDGDMAVDLARITFTEPVLIDEGSKEFFIFKAGSTELRVTSVPYFSSTAILDFFLSGAPINNPGAQLLATYQENQDVSLRDTYGNLMPDQTAKSSLRPASVSATMAGKDYQAGAVTDYTLSFTTSRRLLNGDKFKIKFPAGFQGAGQLSGGCSYQIGVVRIQPNFPLMTFQKNDLYETPPGNYICAVTGVQNPLSGGVTGRFGYILTDSEDIIIEYNVSLPGVSIIAPAEPAPAPEPTPTPVPAPEPAPAPVSEPVPSSVVEPACREKYLPLVISDASAFGLSLIAAVRDGAVVFICNGISPETIALGEGERRALLRDYFDTQRNSVIVWEDLSRLAAGQLPIFRNKTQEQIQLQYVLPIFLKIYDHRPNFLIDQENLAWNTLMYRIRFVRDLSKERAGIAAYAAIFGRLPSTPLDWAAVRVLAYLR